MQYDACGSTLKSLDYAAWSKDLRVQWWYIWWYCILHMFEKQMDVTHTPAEVEIYTAYPKPNIYLSQQGMIQTSPKK